MPSISVIVPVYNVEEYLDCCVESVLKQTFSDFELILVDDGSPDKCPQMCDAYAKSDSRVRVIHKENGGLSDARNVGMEAAAGKYISFIDSDDFIESDMLGVLIALIEKKNADIACCGIRDCYENYVHYATHTAEEIVCNGTDALRLTLEGKKVGGSVCNKLIRKSILGTHRFIKGKTYEDAFFTPVLFGSAETVAITTQPLYNYRHRADSITTCRYSKKSFDVVDAYEYTYRYVLEHCPALKDLAQFRICWGYFVVLDRMLRTENHTSLPEFKTTVQYLRKHTAFICKSEYFQKTRRLSALVLKFSVAGYRLLSALNDKKTEVHHP